ncbi:MAG: YceD family protein [Actinomycetota bacterium]|nr:YceD family protein [Actinomycetota bacterium]
MRTWEVVVEAFRVQEGDDPLRVGDVSVATEQTVRVELILDQVREGVTATGVVSTTWTGECSRCLRPVEGTATAEIEELFEENPSEGESYPLDEEFIDLKPMVREAILLELPVGVVRCETQEECSQLSSEHLGTSEGDEDPEKPVSRDPRWAPLDALVFENEEEPQRDQE